jgi:hypothetical protein
MPSLPLSLLLTTTAVEIAINTTLPSSSTPESHVAGSSEHKENQFLTAPREKIPHIVNHYHFRVDMIRLNKNFHSKFQPIDFTNYRIRAGFKLSRLTQLALPLKIKFHLISSTTILNRTGWLSKASLLQQLLKPFRMNYLPLGWQFEMTFRWPHRETECLCPCASLSQRALHSTRRFRGFPTCVISESLWKLRRDAPCRLSAHGVSNSFTCRQIASPLRLASTVQRNTAGGSAKNVSNRTSCRPGLCTKSLTTAPSTEVALYP